MRNKLFGLAAILALTTVGGISVQQTISTNVEQNSNTEDISTYSQPLPSYVDYTVTYDLPKNSQYITTYVNIDGLATGNDSLNRQYKLDLVETNTTTSTSNSFTLTSFTTPSTVPSNAQYSTTATLQHIFDFTTYTYALELSVLDTTTSTWTVVDSSPVINSPNREAPTYTDSYYTTTSPDLGQTNGSINYNMVINNPNDINYNVNVFLTNTTTNSTQAQTITQDDQSVSFTGLAEGTYELTLSTTTVYGISNQPTYITLLPDIHVPSGSFTVQGVNSSRPGVDGTIYTCGNIADENGATDVVIQTSINGGNTWQEPETGESCVEYNVQPGTYTVKGRIEYVWDGYTHTYDLPDQVVTIGSTAWTSPVGTMTLTGTNETSPVANDGKISGSVNYSNLNNNVTYAEISLDQNTWYDINTGITGLDAGTYTVYGRFHWTDGITSADNITNMTPVQVTVGYNNWNAPSISLNAELDQGVTPNDDGTVNADVIINNDTTGGQGDIEEYVSISTTPGAPGYNWGTPTTGVKTASYAPGTTVYVTGKIAYDHDNNSATAKQEVITQQQTILVQSNPWVAPSFGVGSTVEWENGPAGTGDITANIVTSSGDYESIISMTVLLKDINGNVLGTQVIDASDFGSNGVTQVVFQDVPQGVYFIEYSFSYDLEDGNGVQNSPSQLGSSSVFVSSGEIQPVFTIQPTITTNESGVGANDGSATVNYTITDAGNMIDPNSVDVSLVKWDENTNQYVDVAGSTKTDVEADVTQTWDDLTYGQYRYKLSYGAWNGTSVVQVEYISTVSFTVGRDWTYDIAVTNQSSNLTLENGKYVLTPTIDPNTGEEVATLNYNLTTTNPDTLPYGVKVDIFDVDMNVVVKTETITQGETTASFTGLRPGDYEIRISQTSGQAINGLSTTTIPFTVKSIDSAAYVSDEQIKFTKYSDTEAMFNYYLEIQNPYNKEFQFRVYMYDLTTNKTIASEQVVSNGEGYVSVAWAVYGIQKDHNYALVITDFEGNMVKDLQLGYRTFGDNYDNDPTGNKWWNDMETSTPWSYNFMTWGLILTVIGTGALIAGGVSYRYFYKKSKAKVKAKKAKNQVK